MRELPALIIKVTVVRVDIPLSVPVGCVQTGSGLTEPAAVETQLVATPTNSGLTSEPPALCVWMQNAVQSTEGGTVSPMQVRPMSPV